MRLIHFLFFVAAAFFSLSSPGFAETPTEATEASEASEVLEAVSVESVVPEETPSTAPSAAVDELTWDQFDDPEFDPTTESAEMTDTTPGSVPDSQMVPQATASDAGIEELAEGGVELSEVTEFATSRGIVLGPRGIDEQGRMGRLHTVSTGDTLWDLAAAYLGTAWVWPSVWIDNDKIDNPHLIMPGDRIWITANEMRIVTDAEADSFLGSTLLSSEVEDGAIDEMQLADPVQPLAGLDVAEDDPSTLESFPVVVPGQEPETMVSGRQIIVSQRDAMGFVSAEDLAGASSIVDSPVERTFLAAGDSVVLGMGEGDVEIGDRFTIFKTVEEIRDVETNRVLGHHVDILGWIEVNELTGDTSIGEIRQSYELIQRGVRVMRRPVLERIVTARTTPDAIEGKVVFMPSGRAVMAGGGYVYLNRGEFHGVEIGSELEVFDAGGIVNDRPRRVDVRTPDHPVAKLVVVSVMPETSVAFVLSSSRELEVGDDVRPRLSRLAQR
jgi:hypothetical protein